MLWSKDFFRMFWLLWHKLPCSVFLICFQLNLIKKINIWRIECQDGWWPSLKLSIKQSHLNDNTLHANNPWTHVCSTLWCHCPVGPEPRSVPTGASSGLIFSLTHSAPRVCPEIDKTFHSPSCPVGQYMYLKKLFSGIPLPSSFSSRLGVG